MSELEAMEEQAWPVPSLPLGRFREVAKASRDRDLYADLTRDTVLFRDERTGERLYDWCYLPEWRAAQECGIKRTCRAVVIRQGKRRSGKSAYFGP